MCIRDRRIGQAPDTVLGGALQTARNLIDKGFIGEPVNAQAMVARCYNLTQYENHPDLPFVFTAGGSSPYDMGCYYLHALIHLLGPVKTVAGLSKTFHPKETVSYTHLDVYKRQVYRFGICRDKEKGE